MEKQKLLYQQARLHDRGAAEMVLQTISASKGELVPVPSGGDVRASSLLQRHSLISVPLTFGPWMLNGNSHIYRDNVFQSLTKKTYFMHIFKF
jgi:hypothetical protein